MTSNLVVPVSTSTGVAVSPGSRSASDRRVLQREHHLEQRRVAERALRLQFLHELLERRHPGAPAPRAPSCARARAARGPRGSPARSRRSGSVLTKNPTSGSSSRRFRFATGVPMTRSSRPLHRRSSTAKPPSSTMNNDAPACCARAWSSRVSPASSSKRCVRPAVVITAARDRSPVSNGARRRPRECLPPKFHLGRHRSALPLLALPFREVGILDLQLGQRRAGRPARRPRRNARTPGRARPATSRPTRCGAA